MLTDGLLQPPPMSEPAHTLKARVAAISVFASAGMAAAKFVVGIASAVSP